MREQVLEALYRDKIIAIVRGQRPEVMRDLAGALAAGGIRFLEITFRQDAPETWRDTAQAIAAVHEAFPALHAGAGTVMTPEQLELARAAGAEYIISPNADQQIIRRQIRRLHSDRPGTIGKRIDNAQAVFEPMLDHQCCSAFHEESLSKVAFAYSCLTTIHSLQLYRLIIQLIGFIVILIFFSY